MQFRNQKKIALYGILAMALLSGCQTQDPGVDETSKVKNPEAPYHGEASIESYNRDMARIAIASYDRDAIDSKQSVLAKRSADPLAAQKLYKVRMDYIAQALAKSMRHPEVCKTIKREAEKRFDGDLNFLYSAARGLPAGGSTFGELVESRFNGLSAAEMNNLFDMKLLQVAVPIHSEKWDAKSPLLVGYMTYEVDDIELQTITAYDADLKAYTLSAKVKPSYPVVILSLNERLNPVTMRRKSEEREEAKAEVMKAIAAAGPKPEPRMMYPSPEEVAKGNAMNGVVSPLRKIASSPTPLHIYLEWFKTSDTYDPWPASDGEFSSGVMTDAKKADGSFHTFVQHVKDGVKSGSWYQRHIGLFQYDPISINKYCYFKFHEDDTWEFDVTMSMAISAKGAIEFDKTQQFNGSAKVGNGDDIVGGNQFNVDLGPFNISQASHANVLNAGTVQFASWWGDMNNDGVVLAVPYSSDANNTGKADRWPVSGWPSSPDFTYSIYVDAQATLNINTCNSATAFDTYMTVYNKGGAVVAHNDDNWDPECGSYRSKIVTTLPIGYYYVNVQGYNGAVGNFHLNVVKQ